MATDKIRDVLENVKREVGRIAAGGGTFHDITKPTDFGAFTPAPVDPRGREMGRTKTAEEKPPFGRWLLLQGEQSGFLGQLSRPACSGGEARSRLCEGWRS